VRGRGARRLHPSPPSPFPPRGEGSKENGRTLMNLAAYCLLFTAVGVAFLFVHLVLGKLIRPNKPGVEKGTIYECGEPTVGSAWIQFDLRFYVVALLFVIFDVEVAFFFPWAEVFGRANDVAVLPAPTTAAEFKEFSTKVLAASAVRGAASPEQRRAFQRIAGMTAEEIRQLDERDKLSKAGKAAMSADELLQFDRAEDLAVARDLVNRDVKNGNINNAAINIAWSAFGEIVVFFGVLLVGFVYLWRRGDLAWVRSTAAERPEAAAPPAAPSQPAAQVLTGAGAR
jgi:NADH-quinone oxidoreductase subunit A